MLLAKLKSKIHRATVTSVDINYEGSVSIDPVLLELAKIEEFEQVDIYNISTGARFTTYAISGERGSGSIQINGAAARLVQTGDLIIVACYGYFSTAESKEHNPVIIRVDHNNRVCV